MDAPELYCPYPKRGSINPFAQFCNSSGTVLAQNLEPADLCTAFKVLLGSAMLQGIRARFPTLLAAAGATAAVGGYVVWTVSSRFVQRSAASDHPQWRRRGALSDWAPARPISRMLDPSSHRPPARRWPPRLPVL